MTATKPRPARRRGHSAAWLAQFGTRVIIGLALVLAAASLVVALRQAQNTTAAVTHQKDTAVAERDAAAQQASTLAEQVTAACNAGGASADQLRGIGACAKAEQVKANPVVTAPGPTQDQIAAAVAAYLAAQPPAADAAATAAAVTTAVADYLTAHPAEPGRSPTAAEIAGAVSTYLQANPPASGPAGATGQPGPGPTQAEIAAAVADYMAAHPPVPCTATGTHAEPYTYPDGVVGQRCVDDTQPAPAPTSSPPPPTPQPLLPTN